MHERPLRADEGTVLWSLREMWHAADRAAHAMVLDIMHELVGEQSPLDERQTDSET